MNNNNTAGEGKPTYIDISISLLDDKTAFIGTVTSAFVGAPGFVKYGDSINVVTELMRASAQASGFNIGKISVPKDDYLQYSIPTPSPERLSAEAILDKSFLNPLEGAQKKHAIAAMQKYAEQETAEKDRKIADLRRVMTPKERDPYIELNERNKRIDELHGKISQREALLHDCLNQLEYLSQKFGETGTGNNIIARLKAVIK